MHLIVEFPSFFYPRLSQAGSRHAFSLGNKYCDRLCCGKLLILVFVCMQHVYICLSAFVSTLLDIRVYFWTVRVQINLSTLVWRDVFFLVFGPSMYCWSTSCTQTTITENPTTQNAPSSLCSVNC